MSDVYHPLVNPRMSAKTRLVNVVLSMGFCMLDRGVSGNRDSQLCSLVTTRSVYLLTVSA